MAAETGFTIDGTHCEMPSLNSFTMDESQVLYDYSGLIVEDFAPAEDSVPNADGEYELDDEQARKMKNPGFMRALLHIAYQRKHPKMNPAKVKGLVGAVNMLDLLEQIAAGQEGKDDAVPLASTNTPDVSSLNSTDGSSVSSGNGSVESSESQDAPLAPITTIGSAMSSTPSPTSSAV